MAELAEALDCEIPQLPVTAMRQEGQELALRSSRRFLMVVTARLRTVASLRNFSTASATVGRSGLRTPMRPDACHWWTIEEAAVQLPVFRLRRRVSPPMEPCTQMGHWHRVQRLPFSALLQLPRCRR